MPYYFLNNNKGEKKWPHLGSPLCHFYATTNSAMVREIYPDKNSFFFGPDKIWNIFMTTLNALEEVTANIDIVCLNTKLHK